MPAANSATNRRAVLAYAGSGSLINGISSSVVLSIVPLIAAEFGAGTSTVSWVRGSGCQGSALPEATTS